MVIDLIFDGNLEKQIFYKFVHNKCRVLGLWDEENVKCSYGKFNFPEDTVDFVDSSFVEAEIGEEKRKHFKRPKNRRVNFSELSKDDPFDFQWKNILKDDDELIPIKLIPVKKGVPKRMGFIYSEVEEEQEEEIEEDKEEEVPTKNKFEEYVEISVFTASKFKKIVPMSRLFDLEEKPKINKKKKRKLKKQKVMENNEEPKLKIPQG